MLKFADFLTSWTTTCVNIYNSFIFLSPFKIFVFSCFSFILLQFSNIFSYLSFYFKIVKNSLWLISMSISACDTKASIIFSLLLANIIIWSCFFFLFLVILSNFFIIPIVTEKIKVKLASAILIGAPTKLTEEIIQTPQLYLYNQKERHICLIFYCMIFFD